MASSSRSLATTGDTVLETLRWSIPSVFTLGALVSGLSAVRFASEDNFSTAVTCVVVAVLLDALDGHVARYLDACTKIGFELDSLCDCANFGVVPSLVIFFWAKSLPTVECDSDDCSSEHRLLWLCCCCYSACCALRLARFNVAGHAEAMDMSHLPPNADQKPPLTKAVRHNVFQRKMYFKGVPAPVGAAYALTPMILHFSASSRWAGSVGIVGAWAIGRRGSALTLVITAGLMVCSLPTFSSKMLKTNAQDSYLRSRHVASRLAKVAVGVSLCVACWRFPFDLILVLLCGHLLSIPVSTLVFQSLPEDGGDGCRANKKD